MTKLIDALRFDASLQLSFDTIKSCLIWKDERPEGVSSEIYEFVCDVWIVRSFLHRAIPQEQWGLDPEYFKAVWQEALLMDLKWPGFKRLDLSPLEREYLDRCLETVAAGDID